MNSKHIGEAAKLAVASALLKQDCSVFTEYGDNSEFDLLVVHNNKVTKMQVRSTHIKNGAVTLSLKKTTPGTRKTMCKVTCFSKHVDYFALYVHDNGDILFVKNTKRFIKARSGMTFRYENPRNQQKKKVRYVKDYLTYGS